MIAPESPGPLSLQDSYSLFAPAKINLGLQIGPVRADGYHQLDTVFQTISLADQLQIEFARDDDQDRLTIQGPEAFDVSPSNLILKAVRLLREEGFSLPPVQIDLGKRIPLGAGLGGGSSDAGAILRLACDLFEREPDNPEIHSIATQLGADVPFFLRGGTQRGQGIGEILEPWVDFKAEVVLIVPPVSVDTAKAYQEYENRLSTEPSKNKINLSPSSYDDPEAWKRLPLENDFRPILQDQYRHYKELFSLIEEWTDYSGLSGSGSSLYGLFSDFERANRAVESIRGQTDPGVQIFQETFVEQFHTPSGQGRPVSHKGG